MPAIQAPPVMTRTMRPEDLDSVVALQRLAFPAPFDPELLWRKDHLEAHLAKFPQGQWVAVVHGTVIGSCSNVRLRFGQANRSRTWDETVGGPLLDAHDEAGSELYGLDISVHPDFRGQGVARALYEARFEYVRTGKLAHYVTACRIPDVDQALCSGRVKSIEEYVQRVQDGTLHDRTLTPLLRIGLELKGIKLDYMDDSESRDAAALLEWKP